MSIFDSRRWGWWHGPYKKRECAPSPTGCHCFCDSWTAYDDFGSTQTECCCWCGHMDIERTQSPSKCWTAGDDGERHGPHRRDRTPHFGGTHG